MDKTYKDYLLSDNWKKLREIKLKDSGYKCLLCSSTKNLEVHHRTYDRIFNEQLEDLVVLCKTCHSKHHETFPELPDSNFILEFAKQMIKKLKAINKKALTKKPGNTVDIIKVDRDLDNLYDEIQRKKHLLMDSNG